MLDELMKIANNLKSTD